MADRVIALGAKIEPGTIPGQGCLASVTAADDPWIIEEVYGADEADAGVGAGTYYPVGLTEVDHLMELYWRWRTMRIDWNYTYDDGSGYGSVVVDKTRTTGRQVSLSTGTVDVTREAELVLSAPWLFEGEPFPDPESPPEGGYPGELVNGFVRIFAGTFHGTAAVRYYNGKWYPSIAVDFYDLSLDVDELGAPFYEYEGVLSSLEYVGIHETVTGKLRLSGGTEYDLPMWDYFGAYDPSTFSFVIDALDYWPHKKANGDPKFDTVSGLLL